MITKNCNLFKLGLCVSDINPQPLENFFESKGVKDGRGARCKACIKSIAHERRLKAGGGELRVPKRPPSIPVLEKNCSKFKSGQCASSLNPQPISNFRTQENRINRKSICKACEYKYMEDNREKYIIRARKWNKDHPLKAKNGKMKYNYNFSLEEYNSMLEKQKGNCPICKRHNSEVHQGLVVDHCHTKGHVRGLLCHTCNRALGLLRDSVESLDRAKEYLLKEN